ncbi:hypothetical protein CHUAL_000023 [Chamberlinius hualienensis]
MLQTSPNNRTYSNSCRQLPFQGWNFCQWFHHCQQSPTCTNGSGSYGHTPGPTSILGFIAPAHGSAITTHMPFLLPILVPEPYWLSSLLPLPVRHLSSPSPWISGADLATPLVIMEPLFMPPVGASCKFASTQPSPASSTSPCSCSLIDLQASPQQSDSSKEVPMPPVMAHPFKCVAAPNVAQPQIEINFVP